jgi:hypothetical protein
MKLITCYNCGIVLNLDAIEIPDIVNDDGTIDKDNAIWNSIKCKFLPIIFCPVCKNEIEVGEE